MTDKELLQWHEKAIRDTNDLLGSLSDLWSLCNAALRDPACRDWPPEAVAVLVRVKGECDRAVRRAMQPPTQDKEKR